MIGAALLAPSTSNTPPTRSVSRCCSGRQMSNFENRALAVPLMACLRASSRLGPERSAMRPIESCTAARLLPAPSFSVMQLSRLEPAEAKRGVATTDVLASIEPVGAIGLSHMVQLGPVTTHYRKCQPTPKSNTAGNSLVNPDLRFQLMSNCSRGPTRIPISTPAPPFHLSDKK
jgi:hypothetical protein